MTFINKIIIGIVTALSVAAGAAKVMRAPAEVAFFEAVGLAPIFMTLLGILQIGGGLLIPLPKTRTAGAVIAALSFAVSVVMIAKTGQIGFALVSVLPVLLALYVAHISRKSIFSGE